MMYDLLIVGGGPIGLACGLAAKKAGLGYLILEKGTDGQAQIIKKHGNELGYGVSTGK